MQPQQSPGYAASPLGSFPELSQMYATNFSSPLSNAQAGAQAQQDQVTVSNQKAAEAAAKAQAAAFADKSKYTVQQRADGGYGFYGPDGKEVSAAQYANNTGQKLTDILKDSQNPIDIRYVQDQTNLTKYLQAKAMSKYDKGQATIAAQIEKDVNSQNYKLPDGRPIKIGQGGIAPTEFISYMQQNYPTIYGNNQDNASGFSGANLFLPGQGTAVGQLGGQSKVNRLNGPNGGSHNVNSANPTGG